MRSSEIYHNHIYIYTHTHTHTHTHIYIYIYTHIYTYTHNRKYQGGSILPELGGHNSETKAKPIAMKKESQC